MPGSVPVQNVYAELGSTWWNLMRDPTAAAHVLGKLLVAVGPDNVLWGTDSLWYGSPQDQIQAFRAFEISTELQERYGYPALTTELKRKILGANAARALRTRRARRRTCEFSRDELAKRARDDWRRPCAPTVRRPIANSAPSSRPTR